MIQDAPLSGIDLSVPLLTKMINEIENLTCFKIESAQAASKIRQLIKNCGDKLDAPFDGEESIAIILRDHVLSGSSGDYVVFDAIRVVPSTMAGLNIKGQEINIDQAIRINNAHPNPFNSSITIGYQTENSSTVSIRLFDIFGRVVFSKNDIKIQAGKHSFSWDGKNSFGIDLPSGVYYFSISSKRAFKVKKVVLLK